ncbi:MAG TPA: amidohydrolase, partial [Candidatus Aminicenantes bacterium]|nr:amidohydrolase [Candidatus Aminicenantes bacterium]
MPCLIQAGGENFWQSKRSPHMKLIKFVFIGVFVLGVIHCRVESPVEAADLVLMNGNIVTMDKDNPRTEALAVKGDTIVAVGSNKEIRTYIDKKETKIIDLQGKLALPGFNDSHVHFIQGGNALLSVSLDRVTSFDEIQRRVREKIKDKKDGEWIKGRGWDQEILPGKKWPTKELIDEVATNNPVVLSRICGHCILVNSYALRISGITKDTPNPPGGVIVKDPDTGEPTGILHENAMDLIKWPQLRPNTMDLTKSPQLSDKQYYEMDKKAARLAMKEAARFGVTSLHDLDRKIGFFKELLDEGELTVRVYAGVALTSSPEKIQEYKEWKQMLVDNHHMLKFGVIKGYIDGSLGSSTALLAEPYKNDLSTSGMMLMTQEELNGIISLYDEENFQIAIHAIGDKGVNIVLNAFEESIKRNGARDSRHRIEHATGIIPEDIPRFDTLGVIGSVQPVFGPSYGQTVQSFFEDRFGEKRAKFTNIWKTLLQANALLAFGTDWPVESLNPMEGIYSAVARKSITDKTGNAWLQ